MRPMLKAIHSSVQDISIESALKAFLLECHAKNLSPCTTEWYELKVGYFIQFLNKAGLAPSTSNGTPLRFVTNENLKLFIQQHKEREHLRKRGEKLSSLTVRGTVVGLKVFLKFLYEQGYVAENFAAQLKRPKIQKKIIQALSAEQIQALLKSPDRKTFVGFRDYCMLLTFLDTGMRLSELIHLKTAHIDFSTNSFIVDGKGAKQRRVPFGMNLRQSLNRYLRWRGEIPGHDIVFVSQYGEKMKIHRIENIVKTYGKKTAITGVRMSPHTLLHCKLNS